jgi:hypothetical protein
MGLFSSKSKSSSSTVYDTDTTTTQADQSGNQGLNFAQLGNVALDLSDRSSTTVIATDQGAIGSAERSIAGALGSAERIASGGIAGAIAANSAGLAFGESALNRVSQVQEGSLGLLAGLVDKSIDSSRTLARDSAEANAATVASAISGFGSLAKQTSASSDDRVTKVAGFALAALVAALVLPSLLKGSRA